ncbi:hypothetical protein TNCV_2803071 [Trichonephila clavipes]|nr:hypothetical protein TNCV_2803071 [Trichonephila clavipes]
MLPPPPPLPPLPHFPPWPTKRCKHAVTRLSPFMFHSLNDAYPPSTLGRRRDSIETLGCPTLNGACDYRLEASLTTFIPNPT